MKKVRWITIVSSLLGFYFIAFVLSLLLGPSDLTVKEILSVVMGVSQNPVHKTILFELRLPRIILGLFAGGALSLSGLILQSLFRNPLVEPYTLGISGGASLGICFCLLFKIHLIFGLMLPIFGFLGALSAIMFLYALSIKNKSFKIEKLLLAGVMVSFICGSLMMFIMSVAKIEDLHGIIYWMMGSLAENNKTYIVLMSVVSLSGLFISYFFSTDMNAFLLGEEEAFHLGISVEKIKKILFVLASLLTGVTVSITGIIGFVGLVVPHITKRFIGYDHRFSLVASFMLGGVFLLICDAVARTVLSPLELPVGVITGFFGGSIFIYALFKSNGADTSDIAG